MAAESRVVADRAKAWLAVIEILAILPNILVQTSLGVLFQIDLVLLAFSQLVPIELRVRVAWGECTAMRSFPQEPRSVPDFGGAHELSVLTVTVTVENCLPRAGYDIALIRSQRWQHCR